MEVNGDQFLTMTDNLLDNSGNTDKPILQIVMTYD